jgi:hypothetical protein
MTGGANSRYAWPDEGVTRVPYFVYEDAEIYQIEQADFPRPGVELPGP